jgi:hypothetical protein
VLSHKPLPPRGDGQAIVDGALHEVRLDAGGPEWVFTDREGLVRLGVRAR